MPVTSTDVTLQLKDQAPAAADAVAVLVHKETRPGSPALAALADDLRDAVGALLLSGVVTGKSNELTCQLLGAAGGNGKGRRLLVVGLGNPAVFSAQCLREAGGVLAKAAKRQKLRSLAVYVPATPATLPGSPEGEAIGEGQPVAVEALATGFLLGSFDYREYKGSADGKAKPSRDGDDARRGPTQLTLVAAPAAGRELRDALARARAIADGQNFARTIASRPGNDINPPTLAKVAKQLAREAGLGFRVFDEKQIEKIGMGGLLAVGKGSIATPPRLIVLEYKGLGGARRGAGAVSKSAIRNPKSAIQNPLLVVGKAVTFDTGGVSIKPAEKMGRMIFDKCGAMAVLGMMYAVATLKLPIDVVGILSSAENHISSRAFRPGDILRMYNGVTVEVTNTDAEGRLVLGDALAWGIERYAPQAVVDVATLTGGVVVALGKTMAGVMANDDGLVQDLGAAAEASGEKIWRLPLGDDQRDYIKSEPADIVNSGGREGHPLQGGAFLSFFVKWEGAGKIPWAHLDIAGVADTEKETPTYAKGATGWGVRTLVNWAAGKAASAGAGVGSAATAKGRDRKVPPPAGG
jgi:leucyl aminopeptidase